LRDSFGTLAEIVWREFSRARRHSHPRVNNKRCQTEEAGWPKRYINPFEKDVWNFSKAPHWLLVRREPSLGEKLVYARLTYAPREAEGEKICDRKDVSLGVIFGLNQGEVAKELGMRRESVLLALKALRKRGLIDYNGKQGARACIRFFWHPWMPTCAFNAQVGGSTCLENAQALVWKMHSTCAENAQVTLGTEKRETAREAATAAALTLNDWLKTVVQAKYPDWQLADLQSQWRLHGAKADRKKQWAKGDREHFLKAWMPRATNPRAGKPAEKVHPSEEPKWWVDFVDECYPNAPKMTYGQIAARLPDLIAEGHRWAASRGSV
jgi:hypothetical protein